MPRHLNRLPLCCLLSLSFAATSVAVAEESDANKVLLIVLDGLRPDYVTEERMPNLYAWGRDGVVFEKHHATFPTVTRVNSPSIATGTYPNQHGIADNSVYFPTIEPDKTLSTASRGDLQRIEAATGGHLLTVESMGEYLAGQGMKLGVFSSGSHGSAFLLNHKVPNGAIINTGFILPESLAETLGPQLGEEPADGAPNTARNNRVVDAYLDYGLNELKAPLTIMWLSDPDHTAHEYGMDSPENYAALRGVDDALGRIAATLESRGLLESTNIMVTSDHGFSTHTLEEDPRQVLHDFVATHHLAPEDIIVTGATIYLREAAKPLLGELVETLQRTPWVGPLFTKAKSPQSIEGVVPGTLSLGVIHADHPERAPDIVFSPKWTDDKTGPFSGTVATSGVAGHGSASPWDIHNALIARGPAFEQGILIGTPTHNTDLAPTVCHLLGLAVPPTQVGRVLFEGLREETPQLPETVTTRTLRTTRTFDDGTQYVMEVELSRYRGIEYLDQASATKIAP